MPTVPNDAPEADPAARISSGQTRISIARLVLPALLGLEILVFATIGTHFFTLGNFMEIFRLSVELGLLALALTPVIVTGGIDLSVGSMLGLSAVIFGMLWRDAGLAPMAAAVITLIASAAGGAVNGLLITRLRIQPLIVTLGTYSLFRGVAEGLTRGVQNYTNFPHSFLYLGQGYIGVIPVQLTVFIVASIGFWLLLHRGIIGRALSAIGYSPEGARHAGIPVERDLRLVYILCGLSAGMAALIYVARVGQAKADAGTGYELSAITAVVLGGTSIFGGRGSIVGTLMGLLAISTLQNGLRLADQPEELAGILTGALLLAAIGMDGWSAARLRRADVSKVLVQQSRDEGLDMRNSQLAALSAVILLAALIIAGGNFVLVNHLRSELASEADARATMLRDAALHDRDAHGGGAGAGAIAAGAGTAASRAIGEHPSSAPMPTRPSGHVTIAMMPKSKGNAYFIACRKGADEAAAELGVNLLWDGPTDPDPARQNEIVETWITRGVDAIAVAVENRDAISPALRKARDKGIKVITYDSDAAPDARDFFVNQATPEGIGDALMDDAARVMGDKGDFAIITASLTAANMNEWQKYIELRRKSKYPGIHMVALRPCDDLQNKAFEEAGAILNSYPNVKLIMAICSPAVPGAAEAVKQSGRKDVKVIGLGLPNENKAYIHGGITDSIVLWNTMDLGYLTVYAADELATQKLKAGDTSMTAGHLGKIMIDGDSILLGKPFVFTKENVDRFDF